jgi:hypothetical protein
MQRVSSILQRAALILALTALPVAASADDPQIQPPFPHAVSPLKPPSLWQIFRIVLFNA